MMSGFPANSVFIVDSEDRVRHHTVLDPRLELFCFADCGDDYKSLINPRTSWNLEEVARLVAAYRLCFPLILIVEKTFFVGAGTPMEGRVLPWPAGMGRRTPWTTRC